MSKLTQQWHNINQHHLASQVSCIQQLLQETPLPQDRLHQARRQAYSLIQPLRQQSPPLLESLLSEYAISSDEGTALLCLAESLLRIPDAATRDELVHHLLVSGNWQQHLSTNRNPWVNACSWSLNLAGQQLDHSNSSPQLTKWFKHIGDHAAQNAIKTAIRYLATHFVSASTLAKALANTQPQASYSFDMLGEAALTKHDAAQYRQNYLDAARALGEYQATANSAEVSLSIKLSALHPRYTSKQQQSVLNALKPVLYQLALRASEQGVAITIDAEESERLSLSLALFEQLLRQLPNSARNQVGLAIQAYSKRAKPVLEWLQTLCSELKCRINIRLVKGAYWDSEIRWAQQQGLKDYPVFTLKSATEINYLACAQYLLSHPEQFYPGFASHNMTTVLSILSLHESHHDFECQRLHGMGEAVYQQLQAHYPKLRCRIYSPVGEHRQLLPYLVRRLLENGANNAFVYQLHQQHFTIEQLTTDPFADWAQHDSHSELILPTEIYQPERKSAINVNLFNPDERLNFFQQLATYRNQLLQEPVLLGSILADINKGSSQNRQPINSPYKQQLLGHYSPADELEIRQAIACAQAFLPQWRQTPLGTRQAILNKTAELLEQEFVRLACLITLEAGKPIEDAINEVREAIDFCRYYAAQAEHLAEQLLAGAVGEENSLSYRGHGLFVCISPWNFPLAIFIGQVTAALVSGNCVLAKPAEQTPLVAYHACQLLLQAGTPPAALQCLLGDGEVGAQLCCQPAINGVCFTGSLSTAKTIQSLLTQHQPSIPPLIAETGGINAMIADSSCLPEQLVIDIMHSGFNYAGQRCSALRIVYLQQEIAEQIEKLLMAAMNELVIGNPLEWQTDIGPLIDPQAQQQLQHYLKEQQGALIYQHPQALPTHSPFISPCLLRVTGIDAIVSEQFGPILHVARYRSEQLSTIVQAINRSGYGLTVGIHCRDLHKAKQLAQQLQVGNCYINRNIIGANVGSQPFGGHGLSGTGPKAGGPNYLLRFCREHTLSNNNAALGGSTELWKNALPPK